MRDVTAEISGLYQQLVPSFEEGLLVFRLHEKIKNGEIDANFSTQDIQRAVDEVSKWIPGGVPTRERLLKNLLNYFIERPAEQKTRYCLTEYARKFILLLDHKVNNPFRKFPLRESFKRYADFFAKDITHINQFESWFNQGFQATTRENIIDHLEELKADVHDSVQRLNKMLYSNEEKVTAMVEEFSEIFTDLGAKADEISDTLRLGNTLQLEIEHVVSEFYRQTEGFNLLADPGEAVKFNSAHNAYSRAKEIQSEVQLFFGIVDSKLGQLRDRLQFAATKLNELRELFRYQSHFKRNLKKFLEFALTDARMDKRAMLISEKVPVKMVLEERFKLTVMPDFEREFTRRNQVAEFKEDPDYHQREIKKIETELFQQERTAVLVEVYKERLKTEGKLDLTGEFYTILEQDSEEVAIQVGYELILFAQRNPNLKVDVLPEILERYQYKPIVTWKMNLKPQS